jgi:hypothetical protein
MYQLDSVSFIPKKRNYPYVIEHTAVLVVRLCLGGERFESRPGHLVF